MPATEAQPETVFRADRFRELIDAVEGAPEERFDMNYWVRNRACGTVGCACGWYAMSKPDDFKINLKHKHVIERYSGDEFIGIADWARHFGISEDSGAFLFYAESYHPALPTKAAVLARLRDFYTTKTQQEPAHV